MSRPGIPLPGADHSAEKSQPRPLAEALRPTAAERVRTLVESKATASLTIPGMDDLRDLGPDGPAARAVTPDGDILLLVPAGCAAARVAAGALDDDLTCVMEITDVAPVSVPHRIRGHAWVAGWLTPLSDEYRTAGALLLAERHPAGGLLGLDETGHPERPAESCWSGSGAGFGSTTGSAGWRPGWTLLRFEVGEARVEDLWGIGVVEPEDFAAAAADPLAEHEAEVLQHLHWAHGHQVRGLCGLLGERAGAMCRPGGRAVPVALDRFGLRVRCVEAGGRIFDARFDFPEPVWDVAELRQAMGGLFEAAK